MRHSCWRYGATLAAACILFLLAAGCTHGGRHSADGYGRHDQQHHNHANGLLSPDHITAEFPGKLVYTTERDVDVEALRKDCTLRGGYFNECGSPCEEGAICAQVCAYTCEFR
ncbi:hypothetical protein [Oceanidesulfovibrio marinus]|uniref:Uncharacterized protein n=1 Tax=Oceanidesulfovibrio marinus TaxID=370038 RepID=A0A6P1ZI94_9BACT|nr:hypothetical protein [Oceanidesulfovibrio marinus]TVM35044.1 hypothetical protein DQK91_06485 [Oceanidesulfovibrio marinus]